MSKRKSLLASTIVDTAARLGPRPEDCCHFLVAQTAKEMAAGTYDIVMECNEVRRAWKEANPDANEKELLRRFVARNWAKHLDAARTTLTLMLRGDGDTATKDLIHEALLADASLRNGQRLSQAVLANAPRTQH